MRILGIDPLVGGAPQANLLALATIKDKPFSEVSRPRFATFAKDFSKLLALGMVTGMAMPWNHRGLRRVLACNCQTRGARFGGLLRYSWGRYGLVEIPSRLNGWIIRPSCLLTVCNG